MISFKKLPTLLCLVLSMSLTTQLLAQCSNMANFSWVENAGGNVSFTDLSVPATGGPIAQWYWDFEGNGGTQSLLQNPNYTYNANAAYPVRLIVIDSLGCTDSITISITVTGFACNESFTTTDNGGGTYTFNGTANGSNNILYQWDFGDTYGDTSQNVTHTFQSNGTYYVALFAVDSILCFSFWADTVNVTGAICNSTPGFTSVDNGAGNVSFTNTSTGQITGYSWNFGDGVTSTLQSPVHQYNMNGSFTVRLDVTDTGSCVQSVYDTITPAVQCGVTASYTYIDNGGGNFTFTNTSTNINGGLGSSWNFGDGTTSQLTSPNHTFLANTLYSVVLAEADTNLFGGMCIDYNSQLINVTGVAAPPPCNAGFVIFADSAFQMVLVFNSSTGTNLSYMWDFGDGDTSSLQYPMHTYANSGPYYLCLTIDDGAGCTDVFCDSISSNGIVFKQTGFALIVSPPTAVGVEETENGSGLTIYPNPVTEQLYIGGNVNISNAQIIDMTGRVIKAFADVPNNISVVDLPNGIYFLKLETEHGPVTKKFIKQ